MNDPDRLVTIKRDLIKEILDLEFSMFQTVSTAQRASCQDNPKQFRIMRGSQFSAWSVKTLESYRNDLLEAGRLGKNLMTLKYARMDNLIEPINTSPLIQPILEIQVAWQKELARQFPQVIGRGRPISDTPVEADTSFSRYLSGELETYSGETLENLYEDVSRFLEKNQSMTRQVYEAMAREMGYASLQEAEDYLAGKSEPFSGA